MDENEELNESDIYRNYSCNKCGRKYPETILNIEGVIHHNKKFECLDRKSCEKIKRKKKK